MAWAVNSNNIWTVTYIFIFFTLFNFQDVVDLGASWQPDPDEHQELAFSCGSLVWARQGINVWWPGMVDFCPDNYTFTWTDQVSYRA